MQFLLSKCAATNIVKNIAHPNIRNSLFNKIDNFYIHFPNNTYFFVTNEPNLNLQMQTFATF